MMSRIEKRRCWEGVEEGCEVKSKTKKVSSVEGRRSKEGVPA